MRLERVRAQNFRKIKSADLCLHARCNLVTGDNAAGKTTFLELFHVVSHGQPLGDGYEDALGPFSASWQVEALGVREPGRPKDRYTVSFANRRHLQSINAERCSTADLARALPVVFLEPRSHALVADGPGQRRRYLDWGLFHVEQSFLLAWRRYRRALKQRNALLKKGCTSEALSPWTSELARSGELVTRLRFEQIKRVRGGLIALLEKLVGSDDWNIDLIPGWDTAVDLETALNRSLSADKKSGVTNVGPQRAELLLRRGLSVLRRRVSRGEEKLVVAALLLSQVNLVKAKTGNDPVILIDDFTSELGRVAQERLLQALLEVESQLMVTALEVTPSLQQLRSFGMFHVEHGKVEPMLN